MNTQWVRLSPGGASVEPSKMKRGVLSLLSLLSLLVTTTTASPDGKYWWMGSGDAFGDSQENQVRCRYLQSYCHLGFQINNNINNNNNQYQQGQGEAETERERKMGLL